MFAELQSYLRDLGRKAKSLPKPEAAALRAENAVFVFGTVQFHTGNEDKDDDTELEVWLNKAGNLGCAYSGKISGHYDDGSWHTIPLNPVANIFKKSDLPGGSIRVHIAPNGNDTWEFEIVPVTLEFSDGSKFSQTFLGSTLTQDTPTGDFFL